MRNPLPALPPEPGSVLEPGFKPAPEPWPRLDGFAGWWFPASFDTLVLVGGFTAVVWIGIAISLEEAG